ncbi:MAG: hypothetical protein U0X74_16550 [Anaerolineales bacterium]
MNTPLSGAPQRLTGQDLIRLKKYLADNLLRALETDGVEASQRATFIQQNIGKVFETTQLKFLKI